MTERLADALDAAESALLDGRLADLPDIATRIAATAGAGVIDPADRARARRLAVLLRATGRGLRAAIRRIEEIRKARGGLSTYGAEGQRTTLAEGGVRLTQRF